MMRTTRKLLTGILLLALGATATPALADGEKLPAFPGAEGYGRYTTGGRGGKVYHVTTLEDNGKTTLKGSLRWALAQSGPRTIVFDVDGTIHLQASLSIPSNTTIAGQTAPGMGICVADYPFSITGKNVIVRYIRARLGNEHVTLSGADGWDGFGGFDQRDIIIDHCSVSWSIDECLSVLGNVNTTVQWCIVAQSLVAAGHNKGNHGYGGNWGGSGASFHHNLMAHHSSRTPRLGPRPTTQMDERMDMRNNVIYNWGGNGCYGGEGMKVNIVNNYYKPGPATKTLSTDKQKRIASVGIRTTAYIEQYPAYADALHMWGRYYVVGNRNTSYTSLYNNNWDEGMYNQINASDNDGLWNDEIKAQIKLDEPIPFVHTTTHNDASYAYQYVCNYAGACKGGKHDAFDTQIINDTKGGKATATGAGNGQGFVNTPADNKDLVAAYGSAFPPLEAGEAQADTDGDGIPDSWETNHGLKADDPSDGNATTLSSEGYTNLEVYMNSLVEDITGYCTELVNSSNRTVATVEGQEDVPASLYDNNSGSGDDDGEITSYILSNITYDNSDAATWTFVSHDQTFVMTNGGGKAYGKGTTASETFKLSNNVQHTITLPEGISIGTVKATGYTNEDDKTGYIKELNGKALTQESGTFPARNSSDNASAEVTYELSPAAKGTLTLTTVNQLALKLELIIAGSTGIKSINADGRLNDGVIYNLQGVRVSNPQKGVYIRNGRKVVIK